MQGVAGRDLGACEEGGYPPPEWQELGWAMRVTFQPHPETTDTDKGTGHVPTNVRVNVPINELTRETINETINETIPLLG